MPLALLIWLALLLPDPAVAHTAFPGAKGFYLALLHPLTMPGTALFLAAFALFLQQRLPASSRSFLTFSFSVIAGLILAAVLRSQGRADTSVDLPLCALAVISGLVVATRLAVPPMGRHLLAAAGGLMSGLSALPDPGEVAVVFASSLGGVTGTILLVAILVGSLDALIEKTGWSWAAIAVRVAGSWIVAIATMVAALLLRDQI